MPARHSRGFTLIEVAVVLVVLAILAAIAIPTFTAFMDGTAERSAAASASYVVSDARGLQALQGDALPLSDAVLTTAAGETDDADGQVTYAAETDRLTVDTSRGTFTYTVDLGTGALTEYAAPAVTVVGTTYTNRHWFSGAPLLEVIVAEPAARLLVTCPDVAGSATAFGYNFAYPAPVSATTTHTLVMTMGPGPDLTPSGTYSGCILSVRDASDVELTQTTFALVVP